MKKCTLFCLCILAAYQAFTQTAASWQQTNGPEGGYVLSLCRNTSTIFAGTENGIWASSDEGSSWHILSPVMIDQRVMVVHATDNEIIAFSLKLIDEATRQTVFYRSTDAGQTWTQHVPSDEPPFIELLGYTNINKLWREGNTIWLNYNQNLIYKSDDDGDTWTAVTVPNGANFYRAAISGDKIIAHSLNTRYYSENQGQTWTSFPDAVSIIGLYNDGDFVIKLTTDSLFVSQDFGQTWTGAPTDIHALGDIIKRADGTLAMISSELFLSADGLNWQSQTPPTADNILYQMVESDDKFIVAGRRGIFRSAQNNSVFEMAQNEFKAMRVAAMAALSSGRLVVGTAYNGGWASNNNGTTWEKIPDPSDPYQALYFQEMTAKGDTVFAVRSNDSLYQLVGNTWTNILEADASFSGESFVRVFGNDIFLVEDAQIRRSKNGGATWQTIMIDSSHFGGLRDIARSGNLLFFSTNNGQVYRSPDAGANWEHVMQFSSPGTHRYNRLGVMGSRIFIWSESESFFSDDNGNIWEALAMEGLPSDSGGDIIDFAPADIIYFQNTIICPLPVKGIWISFDQGNTWEAFNNGLTNLRSRRIVAAGASFFIGNTASGVWQLNASFDVFSGEIFNDFNQNGVKDNGEPALPNIIVSAEPLGSFASSDAGGQFNLVAATSLDTLRVALPNNYCTAQPASRIANLPGTGYDFGIHFTPGITDLQVDMTNWEPFRPGFDNHLTLTATNTGTEPVSGAWFQLPIPAHIMVTGAQPFGAVSVINDTLRWQTGTLAPFEHESVQIDVTLFTSAMIGDILVLEGYLDTPDDVNLSNNYTSLQLQIVGSFDPNDKSAAAFIGLDDIALGTPVEYTIRFENTGNFFAEQVVVSDFLESHLDPSTFRIISSSHPCTWDIRQDGTVTFTFADIILLPQETGFVKFAVAADKDLEINESISNTAETFFDFNSPIITNTVKTTVQYPVNTHDHSPDLFQIQVTPNPTTGLVFLEIPAATTLTAHQVTIINPIGKTIKTQRITAAVTSINLSGLPAGTYEAMLMDREGNVLGKKLMVVSR